MPSPAGCSINDIATRRSLTTVVSLRILPIGMDVKYWLGYSTFCCRVVNFFRIRQTRFPILAHLSKRKACAFIRFLNQRHPTMHCALLDIGARGGLKNSGIFAPLQHLKNKTTTGLEPDEQESKRLTSERAYDHIYTDALGNDNRNGFLYVLKGTACSSTHAPNLALLKAYDFRSFPLFQIDHTIPIHLNKPENVLPKTAYDFVKIDIQGSEYDVLSSLNSQFFESVICLSLEVRTIEIYQGEGTIEKVIALLKSKGFVLLAFRDGDCEFLTECDLTFIRDPQHIQNFDQCLKHILAGFLAKRPQYIAYICRYYQRRFGEDKRLKAICKQIGTHAIPISFSDGIRKRKMSKHSHY